MKDKDMSYKHLCLPLEFRPFIIPRIYGYFKIHKEDAPIRPIISATNSIGTPLSKWMLRKLELIAKHLNQFQINSAHHLYNKIEGRHLNNKKHILLTWDYDSMFTNIPFDKTKSIINELYHIIEKETSTPAALFLESLNFLIEVNSYFTFENEIFRQIKGLTMGNSLSPILAEITTNYSLINAAKIYKNDEISFIYKYVDDITTGMDSSCVTEFKEVIECQQKGSSLKTNLENSKNEVDYLQTTIGRYPEENNRIHIRWYQKEYSAKHILDFHSFHPPKIKNNVTQEFVENALKLTSPQHWSIIIPLIKLNLRNSNYKNSLINEKISKAQNKLSKVCITSCIGNTDLDPIEILKNFDPHINTDSKTYNPRNNDPKIKKRTFIARPYHPPIMTHAHLVKEDAHK